MHQYIRAHHNHHNPGPQRNMVLISFLVLFLIAIVGFVLGRMYTQNNMNAEYYAEPTPTPDRGGITVTMAPAEQACTMEAMICPDGSAVGRSGPNCSFAPCPSENEIQKFTTSQSGNYVKYTLHGANLEFSLPATFGNPSEFIVESFTGEYPEGIGTNYIRGSFNNDGFFKEKSGSTKGNHVYYIQLFRPNYVFPGHGLAFYQAYGFSKKNGVYHLKNNPDALIPRNNAALIQNSNNMEILLIEGSIEDPNISCCENIFRQVLSSEQSFKDLDGALINTDNPEFPYITILFDSASLGREEVTNMLKSIRFIK